MGEKSVFAEHEAVALRAEHHAFRREAFHLKATAAATYAHVLQLRGGGVGDEDVLGAVVNVSVRHMEAVAAVLKACHGFVRLAVGQSVVVLNAEQAQLEVPEDALCPQVGLQTVGRCVGCRLAVHFGQAPHAVQVAVHGRLVARGEGGCAQQQGKARKGEEKTVHKESRFDLFQELGKMEGCALFAVQVIGYFHLEARVVAQQRAVVHGEGCAHLPALGLHATEAFGCHVHLAQQTVGAALRKVGCVVGAETALVGVKQAVGQGGNGRGAP